MWINKIYSILNNLIDNFPGNPERLVMNPGVINRFKQKRLIGLKNVMIRATGLLDNVRFPAECSAYREDPIIASESIDIADIY